MLAFIWDTFCCSRIKLGGVRLSFLKWAESAPARVFNWPKSQQALGLTQVLAESIMLSKLTDHKNLVFGRQFHSSYIYFMFNTMPVRSTLVGQSKLYIPSTINIWKKLLSTAIWADKNGLVSGRIACISSKNLSSETI